MDEDKEYYLVYRVYSKEERPSLKERSRVYGWTYSKKILKAFLKQRDEKKYAIRKIPAEELSNRLSRYNDETDELMIDFIKLKSAQTGDEFHLFMTANEKEEVEKRIQRMFDDLSSIEKLPGDISYNVNMLVNLQQKYADALEYIGYRPKEISDVFDSGMSESAYESTYTYEGMSCEEFYHSPGYDYGNCLSSLTDISNKIIYSMESFIKAMRSDL